LPRMATCLAIFPLRQACGCLFPKDYAKISGKAKGRFQEGWGPIVFTDDLPYKPRR
jgi:hypothetical protein